MLLQNTLGTMDGQNGRSPTNIVSKGICNNNFVKRLSTSTSVMIRPTELYLIEIFVEDLYILFMFVFLILWLGLGCMYSVYFVTRIFNVSLSLKVLEIALNIYNG